MVLLKCIKRPPKGTPRGRYWKVLFFLWRIDCCKVTLGSEAAKLGQRAISICFCSTATFGEGQELHGLLPKAKRVKSLCGHGVSA